ncbi:hypothetical protein LOTGIDRAFT_232214 [Lottia gigantea]|uniref:PKD domain-containing protein n=1 Tax=Lottia gigantea TaxID=225164 RepID=V4C0Z5_LOTGI|nr:hypothetical protein LOTGIDRAFT_232214 [Lottia gigantea]ESO95129.1 hypothetical protein LOTGIDRAFT_232214 [Lottia gigantea]
MSNTRLRMVSYHIVCPCQIEGYECDFGYEGSHENGKCKPSSWFDPNEPSVECSEGKKYNKSVGYRKVASDKCKGGIELSDVYKPVVKVCSVVAPNGLSLHTDSNVISTNTPITIELTQAGGSRISTSYTWNFGDNQTKTITGLEKSTQIKHTYKKYGKYNISLIASNNKGKSEAHLFIRVEEKVTLLMLDVPKFTQSQKSTMIEVFTGFSYFPLSKNINHTLFVWTWGDENGSNPELSWLKTIHHTYNKSGLYHGSVETLNSVSSVYKQFTIQVFVFCQKLAEDENMLNREKSYFDYYSNITIPLLFYPLEKTSTVRFGFLSRINIYNFNSNLQTRVLFLNLLKREIMNALGIEDSRLDVHQNKLEPFSVDIILVPGDTGEVKHEDLAKKLIDIVNNGDLSVNLDGSKNSFHQIQVKSASLISDIETPTTNTNNSPNLRPVYIAVPVLIVIVVLTTLVFLYYRRSYRQAKRYSMLRIHNDEDNAMLGEDDDDDEPPLDLNPDFARDRNYHDDQLDLGSGSHLVMVTGGRNSDEE